MERIVQLECLTCSCQESVSNPGRFQPLGAAESGCVWNLFGMLEITVFGIGLNVKTRYFQIFNVFGIAVFGIGLNVKTHYFQIFNVFGIPVFDIGLECQNG